MALMITKYTPILALLALMTACNTHIVYDENVPIDEGKWVYDRAVRFQVEVTDTQENYHFLMNIRNDNTYRYSNLFIFMTTYFPNGNITRDTIEFVLADESGKWLGKGWGRIRENNILLSENLRFPVTGKYTFLAQQAMRDDTLTGITDVGLIIKKAE
jgi:gliding motility-associated lipoprotein GldH